MLDAPSSAFIAAFQASIIAGFFLALGFLISDLFLSKWDVHMSVKWALSYPSITVLSLILMLLHMASNGEIFSHPWLIRVVVIGLAVVLAVRKFAHRGQPLARRMGHAEQLTLLALMILGLLLWCSPMLSLFPLDHTGDTSMHMGWASQLMNGERVPSVGIIGDIPNSYPWLFHALAALLTRLTPGGRAFHALGPLQILQVMGSVLAFFALGRELTNRWITGGAAALLGALSGGFGFLIFHQVDIAMEGYLPEGQRYMGDLIWNRAYNLAFYNVAPPFPRDAALPLIEGFLLLMIIGLRKKDSRLLLGAGFILGAAGLIHSDGLFVGILFVIVIGLAPGMKRVLVLASVLLPALSVFGLWTVPLFINYLKSEGFSNLAASTPVVLGPLSLLVAWGIAAPLGIYGAIRSWPEAGKQVGIRVVPAFTVAALILVLSSQLIPKILGEGFRTLGYPHRYWPFVYLGIALFGAFGLTDILHRARRMHRTFAVCLATVIALLGISSPAVSAMALPENLSNRQPTLRPMLVDALTNQPDSILNALAPTPSSTSCRLAAPLQLTLRSFSYTGYRHIMFFRGGGLDEQIRWTGALERIGSRSQRVANNTALVTGSVDDNRWERLIATYRLDMVVVPKKYVEDGAFEGYRLRLTDPTKLGTFALLRINHCGV